MSLRSAAREQAERLRAAGIEDAHLEAEVLARAASGASRTAYFAGAEPRAGELDRLHAAIERRLQREPSAYITGRREFYGREFAVGPGVLVPRPETELLVELALAEASARCHVPGARLVIVDVGTGSGCIAISIAAELAIQNPESKIQSPIVIGLDISPQALRAAQANAAALGTGHRVPGTLALARTDLLAPIRRADIVLANLPYIPSGEIDALEPEVSRWEPRVALDGGRDGFDLIRRLIADCDARLRPSLLALEVGFGQAEAVGATLRAVGREPWLVRDLGGIDRVACARWE